MIHYECPLIEVGDMKRSVAFYREVLGLEIVNDCGANVTLTGGISLQTLDTWKDFLGAAEEDIKLKNRARELYFVAEDMDAFWQRLQTADVELVHPLKEHGWGQRVVRLYDPDGHVIEVGESLRAVAQRFREAGMDVQQIAVRMDVSAEFAASLL